MSVIFTELGLIVKAGIPISEGILMLSEDEPNAETKEMLRTIYDKVDVGESFALAVRESESFPEYAVEMITIGEETGNLENVFTSLSTYYERRDALAKTIRSAVFYPTMLMSMALIVVLVLIIKVMPIFSDVFKRLGSSMPPSAEDWCFPL